MNIREEYKKLTDEMKTLEAARNRWQELFFKADELREQIEKEDEQKEYDEITKETQFKDCEGACIGYPATQGSVILKSAEQAGRLAKVLNKGCNYHNCYKLEYSGLGEYNIDSSYHFDHDSEMVYTSTIKKREE